MRKRDRAPEEKGKDVVRNKNSTPSGQGVCKDVTEPPTNLGDFVPPARKRRESGVCNAISSKDFDNGPKDPRLRCFLEKGRGKKELKRRRSPRETKLWEVGKKEDFYPRQSSSVKDMRKLGSGKRNASVAEGEVFWSPKAGARK